MRTLVAMVRNSSVTYVIEKANRRIERLVEGCSFRLTMFVRNAVLSMTANLLYS